MDNKAIEMIPDGPGVHSPARFANRSVACYDSVVLAVPVLE